MKTIERGNGVPDAEEPAGCCRGSRAGARGLNDVICVAEGTILPDPNRIEIHVYGATNELIAG